MEGDLSDKRVGGQGLKVTPTHIKRTFPVIHNHLKRGPSLWLLMTSTPRPLERANLTLATAVVCSVWSQWTGSYADCRWIINQMWKRYQIKGFIFGGWVIATIPPCSFLWYSLCPRISVVLSITNMQKMSISFFCLAVGHIGCTLIPKLPCPYFYIVSSCNLKRSFF